MEGSAGHMHQFGTTRSLGEAGQHVFGLACREFASVLAPYVVRCFLQIYPEASAEVDAANAGASLKKLGLQLSKDGGEIPCPGVLPVSQPSPPPPPSPPPIPPVFSQIC